MLCRAAGKRSFIQLPPSVSDAPSPWQLTEWASSWCHGLLQLVDDVPAPLGWYSAGCSGRAGWSGAWCSSMTRRCRRPTVSSPIGTQQQVSDTRDNRWAELGRAEFTPCTHYSRLTTHRTFRPQDVYNLAYSDKTQAPSCGCFNYSCHSVRMSFWIKSLLIYIGETSRGRTELTKGRNIHKSLSHGRLVSLHGIVHVTTGYVLASRHRYKWRECNCPACYVIVVWRHTDDWVVTSRVMTSVSRGRDRQFEVYCRYQFVFALILLLSLNKYECKCNSKFFYCYYSLCYCYCRHCLYCHLFLILYCYGN